MTEPTIRFICLVRDMRTAQKEYFLNIAKAKKSKLPADYAAAANALKRSKLHEQEVDAQVLKFETQITQSPAELT